jgi:D-sedoheptulose 7-phosphate isomerase
MSNQIEKFFNETKTPAEYSRNYLGYLSTIFSKINEQELGKFIEVILKAREDGRAVYFIGNGGSAATASHFANDIQIGTRPKGKPFKVQSLTDNVAILTAVGNDFGYDFIFTKQLEALLNEGDVVVAISASGNSLNIIHAIDYAHSRNCITVGLTGFDGGKLKSLATHNLHVPSEKGEYGPVEDLHMIFDHIIGSYLLFHCRKNDA